MGEAQLSNARPFARHAIDGKKMNAKNEINKATEKKKTKGTKPLGHQVEFTCYIRILILISILD